MPGVVVVIASEEAAGLAERADAVVDGPEGVVRLLVGLASHV